MLDPNWEAGAEFLATVIPPVFFFFCALAACWCVAYIITTWNEGRHK